MRKAPLNKIPAPQGWCFYQTKTSSAWAFLEGKRYFAKGQDAKGLIARAESQKALVEEIPEHFTVLSTGIDLQVHLRFPGQGKKELLEGGLESALLGGYDSVVTMPNTSPYLDRAELLAQAIQEASSTLAKYPVRVGFTASATRGMQGQEKTDIPALAKAGAVAITDDGWGVKSDQAMEEIFRDCQKMDLLFQQHAEMPGHKGVASESAFQRSENLPPYPRNAESEMVRRDIRLLQKVPGARYHVLHVSTRESLEEIRRAKEAGLPVTAEVSPHHLFFANSDIPPQTNPLSSAFKMNPPLFAPEDREALVEALASGLIDCVSTDHAPHEADLKAKGWLLSPFGTRGMETALPVLFTLHARGKLTLQRLEEVFHSAPRRVLARPEFKEPSGLLIVDPRRSHEITEGELPGISKNSCFLGTKLTGRLEIRAEKDAVYRRI